MTTMEEMGPARVVPSGKVYRQMFDAEVQLVRALEKRESTIMNREGTGSFHSAKVASAATIPLVRQVKNEGSGILNSRQKTWIESFPNESHVENPVVYKFYSEEIRGQETEPEKNVASKEVQGLPDVLAPAKIGSDIIERIGESRKQRHEAAIEDMHQELGLISNDFEPHIDETGNKLLQILHLDDVEIETILARIQSDEDMMRYKLPELEALWEEVAAHSVQRQQSVHSLDTSVTEMEAARIEKVRDVFQHYAKVLEKVAHLMPPDLQRLLDKESQLINQTVLSNRRAYADLYSRLMMADIDREKRLHTHWQTRVEDWRRLHTEAAVKEFCVFMESEAIEAPPGARMVLEHMQTEQASLNKRRLELILSLKDLKPPSSTKTGVYHWNQQVIDVSKEIDALNQEYFTKLYAEYEKVCQHCLAEVEKVKTDLVVRGICTENKAQDVINQQCLPLVGERQTTFEKILEEMDKSLETHNAYLLDQLKSLFKFCQGAAHVWDVHEIGLARQERALQEMLDNCRHGHDNQNQEKEAQLDIVMDRMRQDATEQSLQDSLKVALDMLSKIKDGYEVFHSQQLNLVAKYPDMVQGELHNFDKAVCKFFGVDRSHPEEKESETDEDLQTDAATDAKPKPSDNGKKKKKKPQGADILRSNQAALKESRSPSSKWEAPSTKRATSKSQGVRAESRQDEGSRSPLPMAVSEVLSTTKGTTFYVLTVAGEHGIQDEADVKPAPPDGGATEPAFLTESSTDTKPVYLRNADVSDEMIRSVKKAIRLNFLDHLEEWTEQAQDRSRSVVAAKTEELNSELDLRMHLHQPRSRRAELDVHNVRAAELVMHSERVARHCKGINQALSDLKTRFNDMTEEHNRLANTFRQDIEALEVVFINATKSAKLVALSNQLQVEQEKYMTVIRTSLRQFRQHLDDTLQMLRESNARFIKSFKVFSDGGNFCPEEIEDFRKRLEKMAQKIDSSEGLVMADLEGMESKRLDQASKIAGEFEDRFKHHMVDLVFMEKIARWLTNTQVKIKAEVADSNTQAQKLAKFLTDLDRRIDACEKPNPDKEHVTPTSLNAGLKEIFDAFHDRSRYLNCVKDHNPPPPPTPLQGNPAQAALQISSLTVQDSVPRGVIHEESDDTAERGMRVGFASETVLPVSKPGKQLIEDPSVGVIKNILKTQKSRLKGLDTDCNGDLGASMSALGGVVHPAVPGQPAGGESRDKGLKHRQPRPPTDTDSRSKKSSRTTTSNTNTGDTPKRVHSGHKRNKKDDDEHCDRKGAKFDRKYLVFGEKEEQGEDGHLLGKVRHLLREALDGLLSAAEVYYRTKATRPVTRPQALQETFEGCADVVVAKLQSYYSQADDYHNQCLQELRHQLQHLEKTVTAVPTSLIGELLQTAIEAEALERSVLETEFSKKLQVWDKQKVNHQNDLRPTLGHPQQEDMLRRLCAVEDARRDEYLQGVNTHTNTLQEVCVKHAQVFVERLAKVAEQLLLQADGLLTVDDVERGRVPTVKHPTSELLRRQNAGEALEDAEPKETMSRGKNTWPGLPKDKLVVPSGEQPVNQSPEPVDSRKSAKQSKVKEVKEPDLTASVTTGKTTLVHKSTVAARDKAYQDYQRHFEHTLGTIAAQKQMHTVAEQRWTDSWRTSVNKVKTLY